MEERRFAPCEGGTPSLRWVVADTNMAFRGEGVPPSIERLESAMWVSCVELQLPGHGAQLGSG